MLLHHHCVKSVRIRSYSGPYFTAFGLNTERHEVSLRIQSECGKIRTRITLNTDTFYVVMAVVLCNLSVLRMYHFSYTMNEKNCHFLDVPR